MHAFELDRYRLRRKVLKLFGAAFHAYDEQGRVIAFASQAAFKLREDLRVYTDETQREALLVIQARQILDFAAAYDVFDPRESEPVGCARRKGFRSMLRDSWELLDAHGRPLAQLQEESAGMALVRRLLANWVPQSFTLSAERGAPARLKQRWNPVVYHLEVEIPRGCEVDRRMILATAVLLAAIEGRQN